MKQNVLTDLEELDVKDQGGLGGDDWGESTVTVTVIRADLEGSALAERHLGDALLPATDNTANTNGGDKGIVAVAGRIELGAVLEGADVVHDDSLADLGESNAVSGLDDGLGNTHDGGSEHVGWCVG